MTDSLDVEAKNLISLLAENNRMGLLASIAEIYERMKAHHQKTLEVEITSAYELSSDESEALKNALSAKLGRDIELDISVDEKLIGGVIIKAEDNVIDDSVKGRLEKFANNLN